MVFGTKCRFIYDRGHRRFDQKKRDRYVYVR